MDPQLGEIRPLDLSDLTSLLQMDTGIEDDYIIRIYSDLVKADNHSLLGLFHKEQLLSIGGYSLFGKDTFAMIGRLRTDRRYAGQGFSTQLVKKLVQLLSEDSRVSWAGANTHVHNNSARKVLEKAGLASGPVIHSLVLTKPGQLKGYKNGEVWKEIHSLQEKKDLLVQTERSRPDIFPYECYYPLPYHQSLFTDKMLSESYFYASTNRKRFVIIKTDQKKYRYSHVKYFWDDHYTQPGFFETIRHHWKQHPDNYGCWLDFSPTGFSHIPDLSPYEVQEPWVLYEKWK
ncbi:GNAT family N-acetyltransferase [Halobacillus rhizosphaerae]|uniref:GNAT family N-acetyltransferase n=1 Tax=Halobacillus rhizosphaerae TaxID=3064889 RepID=UPI00398BB20F